MAFSLAIALAGIYMAWQSYMKRTGLLERISSRYERVGRVLFNKYYVDEVYDVAVVNPTVKVSEKLLWKGVDVAVIDGALNGLALLVTNVAMAARKVQTGVVQMYALVFVGGIVFVVAWLVFR
jgi:NADH-quinone oxidoreductase subunit L